jgi:hypothetical protein
MYTDLGTEKRWRLRQTIELPTRKEWGMRHLQQGAVMSTWVARPAEAIPTMSRRDLVFPSTHVDKGGSPTKKKPIRRRKSVDRALKLVKYIFGPPQFNSSGNHLETKR